MFYAGHGIQVDGNNYLVPIDAAVLNKSTAQFEMIDIDRILKGLDDEAHANIIILDACRDNSFESRIAPSRPGGRGAGLTGYQSVGTGTLIAFATAPGNTAADGTGAHSPFTAALLKLRDAGARGEPDVDAGADRRRCGDRKEAGSLGEFIAVRRGLSEPRTAADGGAVGTRSNSSVDTVGSRNDL